MGCSGERKRRKGRQGGGLKKRGLVEGRGGGLREERGGEGEGRLKVGRREIKGRVKGG